MGARTARPDAECEFLQPSPSEPRRERCLSAEKLKRGFLCGIARRDECADDLEHLPASAGSKSKVRAEAGAIVDPASGISQRGRFVPDFSAGEWPRVHANREVFSVSGPMSGMNLVASKLDAGSATYRCVVPAGEPWTREIGKGQYFRIVDLKGNQAADTLFYNARDYSDRYRDRK